MSKREYDIEVKGKKYRKEDLVYDVNDFPGQRMLFCSAFYNLWVDHKGIRKSHSAYETFMKYFNKVYRPCKRENRPMTWQDLKNLDP